MRLIYAVLACFLSVSVHAADIPFRLAVFGDSLSAGYGLPESDAFYTRLEQALNKKKYHVSVIHASQSGVTTDDGLARQAALIAQKTDAVLSELGINDAMRDTPLQTTREHLEQIIQNFQQNNIAVMLIGMIAPQTGTQSIVSHLRKCIKI